MQQQPLWLMLLVVYTTWHWVGIHAFNLQQKTEVDFILTELQPSTHLVMYYYNHCYSYYFYY